ncbi:hypothetical protein COY27_01905 [Candidatus Woesearchaeota archaeon CG_4_10_14_0_2_um_filter_33_13]|nr:MAG: hypothetical protein COY27_01905 [Candidatus Woesearchaeota archaeon CG_4_10_14_0_2_um_filter_33_13]
MSHKKLDRADKVQLVVSYTLQIIILITSIIALLQKQWQTGFFALSILLLTALPGLIRRNYKIYMPVEIDLIVILFVFFAIFLGEIHSYYTIFWWWDIMLHISSGFLLGIAGFFLVHILNEERKLSIQPKLVVLFAFAFAVALGAIWEIFEFSIDQILGLTMQNSSLVDTMWDLIVDTLGAVVISFLGYFYLNRKTKSLLFERLLKRFLSRNRKLFKKKK